MIFLELSWDCIFWKRIFLENKLKRIVDKERKGIDIAIVKTKHIDPNILTQIYVIKPNASLGFRTWQLLNALLPMCDHHLLPKPAATTTHPLFSPCVLPHRYHPNASHSWSYPLERVFKWSVQIWAWGDTRKWDEWTVHQCDAKFWSRRWRSRKKK